MIIVKNFNHQRWLIILISIIMHFCSFEGQQDSNCFLLLIIKNLILNLLILHLTEYFLDVLNPMK